MQGSKVCINDVAPDIVTVDFALAARQLNEADKGYGFAYHKALEHLGLEKIETDEHPENLVLRGSVETMRQNTDRLHRHIGVIARYGAQSANYFPASRDSIGRILGHIAQNNIPGLPENATLMRAVGVVTSPFADAVHDDYLHMYYSRRSPWRYGYDEPAHDEHGKPLAPYAVRDIGGLEIDASGMKARERYRFDLAMDRETLYRLQLLTIAEGKLIGEEVRASMRHLLDQPTPLPITHRPVGKEKVNFQATFHRADLAEAVALEHEPETSLGDIARTAIDSYLQFRMQDPDTHAKVQAAAEMLRQLP